MVGGYSNTEAWGQNVFDEALKRVCGDSYVPFEQRYEWIDNNVI